MSKVVDKFKGLTKGAKAGVIGGALYGALITTGIVGAATSSSTQTPSSTPQQTQATTSQTESKQPVTETKRVEEKSPVPYSTVNKNDSSLEKGTTEEAQAGSNGERTVTYEITLVDGKETSRKKVSEKVIKSPVDRIVLIGTYVAPKTPKSSCDSNYSGACVPIASDVDCASGSGNGPAYVSGPVYVVGTDIYDLDRDGDGVGCQ